MSGDSDEESIHTASTEDPDPGTPDGVDDGGYATADTEEDVTGGVGGGESEEDEEEVDAEESRMIAKHEKERLKQLKRAQRAQLLNFRAQHKNDLEAQNAELAVDPKVQAQKKLRYLLAQTEVFSHFLSGAGHGDPALGTPKKGKRGASKGSGRGNKTLTEEEEDMAMMEAEGGAVVGTRITAQPTIITATLREYQLQGLDFMVRLYDNGINGILADEMGLGKTLQSITLLAYLYEHRGITGPHIIIVPKSTLSNWMKELKRWCPTLRALKFHGNADERKDFINYKLVAGQFDVIVTSFEVVIKEKNALLKFRWQYLIIDEAHRIKNENSRLSVVVRMLRTNQRLLLTGTPLQNNLHELWALLNFLMPEVFGSASAFDEWFNVSGEGDKADTVKQLQKVLRPFLLRRIKMDVEKSLLPKREYILKVGMSDLQRQWYKTLLQKDIDVVNGVGVDRSKLLNIVMQLRKCCNHPYLFEGAEPGPPYTTGDHLIETSGKLNLLDKLLPRLQARGSRVLVFSQMTRMMDILEDYCLYRQYKYCRIDGNTSGDDRERLIDEYNEENSEKFIFLLSTRAGGLGINLYTADVVVLYDSDWNPQVDLQAMDRAHRIGQKKEVQVFRFATENTIDEKVIERAYAKLELDALVIQQGRMAETNKALGKDELLNMVRFGAEQVFSTSGSQAITDEDIDALISKGEKQADDLNNKMKGRMSENLRKFALDGQGVDLYQGDDDENTKDWKVPKAMFTNWVDPPRRERKKVGYSDSEAFRAISASAPMKPKEHRAIRTPTMHDYQFFDVQRIEELYNKENAHAMHVHQQQQKLAALQKAAGPDEDVKLPEEEGPPPLTEEEREERDRLEAEAFGDWKKLDFTTFCKACELYGRTDRDNISQSVPEKDPAEVLRYLDTFLLRYQEIVDHDRIIKNIERGEEKIAKRVDMERAVELKLKTVRNPWKDLRFTYGSSRSKAYTEDNDRFLFCMMHKLGYGNWDELKLAVRKSWLFRFDWFLKSRTPQELGRRCDTLVRLAEKDVEAVLEAEKKAAKAASKGTSSKGTPVKQERPAASGTPQQQHVVTNDGVQKRKQDMTPDDIRAQVMGHPASAAKKIKR